MDEVSEKTSEGAERDGGGVFPQITEIQTPHSVSWQTPEWSKVRSVGGMTLRDWFAGQVLAGLVANAALARDPTSGAEFRARIAETAYAVADSALAERRK